MESKKCQWLHRGEIRESSLESQGISRRLEIKEICFKKRAENDTKETLAQFVLSGISAKAKGEFWRNRVVNTS